MVKLTSRWFSLIQDRPSCLKIATYQLWWNVLKFERGLRRVCGENNFNNSFHRQHVADRKAYTKDQENKGHHM